MLRAVRHASSLSDEVPSRHVLEKDSKARPIFSAMTRRMVRSGFQLGAIILVIVFFAFFIDNRYSVLPSKFHKLSPAHHAGLAVIDVTVTTCSFLSSCAIADKWIRIEKDLYLGDALFSKAYIDVLRKKEEDLTETDKVVLDVRISKNSPAKEGENLEQKTWEKRPGGIWLLRSLKRHASDSKNAITAVDVLFGADAVDPRTGWSVKELGLDLHLDRRAAEPRLTVRHGQPPTTALKPTLRVRKDGKFKILQVSDMHMSTGLGRCRDEFPAMSHCEADPRTVEFVDKVLEAESPDLVVLSGDLVNGETAPDAQSALYKAVEPFAKRKIPFALVFGNHDDTGSLSRSSLMKVAEELPFSLSEPGRPDIQGVGNYYIEVLARTSEHSALTLYMLDTHSYSPDEANFKGYDWLKQDQLNWFRELTRHLRHTATHQGYAHKHLDMAFVHIPLPEYRSEDKKVQDSGSWREPPTAPNYNAGFKDLLVEEGVFAISCGHDHVNDYCVVDGHSNPGAIEETTSGSGAKTRARDGKLWMCYAGGAGYGGYGGYGGYKRRVRVWEFDMNEPRVDTWKRVDGGDGRVEHKRVMDGGNVVSGS